MTEQPNPHHRLPFSVSRPAFVILLSLFTAFSFSALVHADGNPPDVRSLQVDLLFSPWDSQNAPGCAVGVYGDGEILHARGYGMANLEHGIPLDADTVFRTASISKQFTAAVIAKLHRRGELSLDDTLDRYFPEFPAYASQVTLRHMIHHTSGIRDYLVLADLAGFGEHYTNEELLNLLRRQKNLNFPPGQEYLYSNAGYFLLGQIVDRSARKVPGNDPSMPVGSGLEKRAQELIFGPLGMKSTHFHHDAGHLIPRRADGHDAQDDGTFKLHNTELEMVGDGGVFTTINDLLHWNNFLRGGQDRKHSPEEAELIEMLTTPTHLNSGEQIHYAFGLRHDVFNGIPALAHSGSYVGFRAAVVRFPEQDLGIAVLCNRNRIRPYDLAFEVAQIYLKTPSPEATPSEATLPGAAPTPKNQSLFTATYWDDDSGTIQRVYEEDSRLFMETTPGEMVAQLIPLDEQSYRLGNSTIVTFEPGRLTVADPSGKRSYQRFQAAAPPLDVLQNYVGNYYSEELNVAYRIVVRDASLVVFIPRYGEYVLQPQVPGVFTHSEVGSFRFASTENAAPGAPLREFELDAGRVRNLRFLRVAAAVSD